jgi:hypothetical protein
MARLVVERMEMQVQEVVEELVQVVPVHNLLVERQLDVVVLELRELLESEGMVPMVCLAVQAIQMAGAAAAAADTTAVAAVETAAVALVVVEVLHSLEE